MGGSEKVGEHEQASERGSERTQLHGANTNSSKNRSNKTETQLLGANTTSSENRNNKTETTHTTENFHFMSSVAISVHCCLHWCSHRHLASMLAPCIYPAILHRCSRRACYHCSSLLTCVPFRMLEGSSTMAARTDTVRWVPIPERIQRPVLYAANAREIRKETDDVVTVRVRGCVDVDGTMKMMLHLRWSADCHPNTVANAENIALDMIENNSE